MILQNDPPQKARSLRAGRPSTASGLPLGGADHEAIKGFGHFDLARQPGIRLNPIGEVEHVFFHRRRLANRLAPSVINVDMARRAGASAAAFSLDAGDAPSSPSMTVLFPRIACEILQLWERGPVNVNYFTILFSIFL